MISGDLNFASDWLVALGNLPFVCVTYFLNFVHLLTNTHTHTNTQRANSLAVLHHLTPVAHTGCRPAGGRR